MAILLGVLDAEKWSFSLRPFLQRFATLMNILFILKLLVSWISPGLCLSNFVKNFDQYFGFCCFWFIKVSMMEVEIVQQTWFRNFFKCLFECDTFMCVLNRISDYISKKST